MIPFIQNAENTQIHNDRKWLLWAGGDRGEWGMTANGWQVSPGDDENVLVVTVAQLCE